MKHMVALGCLILAMVAGQAWSSDLDVHQMQWRLAAQEARMADQDARMNDLHAKIANSMNLNSSGSSADSVISLQKNAKVTIGGLVTTKYTNTTARVSSVYGDNGAGEIVDLGSGRARRAEAKAGSLAITDAEIYMQVDVNDNFDAYLELDLQNDARDYYIAKAYYVRWKNICNTGFGIKVGRDALVFGEEGFGELASYAAGGGDGLSELGGAFDSYSGFRVPTATAGVFAPTGGIVPIHNGWDVDGVVQVTPYWEGFDGKFKLEMSFMQSIDDDTPYMDLEDNYYYRINSSGVQKIRSRNYGLGSMSLRATYEPIENLKFTAGVVNYHMNGAQEWDENDDPITDYSADSVHSKNNTAFALAASWRPCFAERFLFWGQWIHGNDVYFHKGMKSDAINYGVAFDIAEGFTAFAQGDYLRTKYKHGGMNQKATAWAFYTGLQYSLPYGVSFEAGWKHENVKYKDGGRTTVKATGNTLYLLAGFEF